MLKGSVFGLWRKLEFLPRSLDCLRQIGLVRKTCCYRSFLVLKIVFWKQELSLLSFWYMQFCRAHPFPTELNVALECQTSSGFQAYCSTSTSGMNLCDRSNDAFNVCIVINLKYIYQFCKISMRFIKLAKQFRILKRNLAQKENVTYTKCVRISWAEEPYSDHLQRCTKWV